MVDSEDMSVGKRAKKIDKSYLILGILVVVAALIFLASFGLWMASNANTNEIARSHVQQLQATSDFPLYYPGTLPEGFKVTRDSVSAAEKGLVSFSLDHNGEKKLVVSQQARPPRMEEVSKVREFTTAHGQAYIANLNGRTTGFMVTDKTLVIISPIGSVNNDQIEQVIQSLNLLDNN